MQQASRYSRAVILLDSFCTLFTFIEFGGSSSLYSCFLSVRQFIVPYMGYIGMCGPKGYGFVAVLVRYWASILAILVSKRLWCSKANFCIKSINLNWNFKRDQWDGGKTAKLTSKGGLSYFV